MGVPQADVAAAKQPGLGDGRMLRHIRRQMARKQWKEQGKRVPWQEFWRYTYNKSRGVRVRDA